MAGTILAEPRGYIKDSLLLFWDTVYNPVPCFWTTPPADTIPTHGLQSIPPGLFPPCTKEAYMTHVILAINGAFADTQNRHRLPRLEKCP